MTEELLSLAKACFRAKSSTTDQFTQESIGKICGSWEVFMRATIEFQKASDELAYGVKIVRPL